MPKITTTASSLFALAVVIMIASHIFNYFLPDNLWLRLPDRIASAPIFLIAIGYNSGQRLNKIIIFGAILTFISSFLVFGTYFINILGTIILIRYTIEPIANFLLRSKFIFWAGNLAFIILFPLTAVFFDYGTLAFIMALAGWINKNGEGVSGHIVKPLEYFIFAGIIYTVGMSVSFGFSNQQTIIIAVGLTITMALLYNMRTLLMNSIRNKPTDMIGRFCKFLGHKSLEIYIVHIVILDIIMYYILNFL